MKQHLMASEKSLSEDLNQALKLEVVKAAAGSPVLL
jgi:hypothetical protein